MREDVERQPLLAAGGGGGGDRDQQISAGFKEELQINLCN